MTISWPPDIGIEPYYQDKYRVIYKGDCREIAPALKGITAVVTDPPYELGFMGKSWDSQGVSFQEVTWGLIKMACLPGAMMLSFGGSRTSHRIAVAIEDAGWELRDTVMWVYGQGFPKSLDISKAIDKINGTYVKGRVLPSSRTTGASATGIATTFREKTACNAQSLGARLWAGYGTALKPAYEPIIVAMNPLDGTFAQNAIEHGVAGINIDGCRVEVKDAEKASFAAEWDRFQSGSKNGVVGYVKQDGGYDLNQNRPTGRFPANFIHDGSEEVLELFPQSKTNHVDKPCPDPMIRGHRWSNMQSNRGAREYDEDGSAARFFYTPKASRAERNNGCEQRDYGYRSNGFSAHISDSKLPRGNNHPTVKPLALMEYLCRLVKMPERNLILDPFCGSGTTLLACGHLGIMSIGIDSDEKSCEIAANRCAADAAEMMSRGEY